MLAVPKFRRISLVNAKPLWRLYELCWKCLWLSLCSMAEWGRVEGFWPVTGPSYANPEIKRRGDKLASSEGESTEIPKVTQEIWKPWARGAQTSPCGKYSQALQTRKFLGSCFVCSQKAGLMCIAFNRFYLENKIRSISHVSSLYDTSKW